MVKLKPGTAYWVEWVDAFSGPNTWMDDDEIDEMFTNDYVMWTMGWLIKTTKKYYIFASTVSEKRGVKSSVWAIPKGMIINIKEASYG